MIYKNILLQLLRAFEISLFLRLVIDYIRIFARNWRPNAFFIAIFEVIYVITEKPMALVRRFIPPLRMGGAAIDLSFIVLIFAINLAQKIVVALP